LAFIILLLLLYYITGWPGAAKQLLGCGLQLQCCLVLPGRGAGLYSGGETAPRLAPTSWRLSAQGPVRQRWGHKPGPYTSLGVTRGAPTRQMLRNARAASKRLLRRRGKPGLSPQQPVRTSRTAQWDVGTSNAGWPKLRRRGDEVRRDCACLNHKRCWHVSRGPDNCMSHCSCHRWLFRAWSCDVLARTSSFRVGVPVEQLQHSSTIYTCLLLHHNNGTRMRWRGEANPGFPGLLCQGKPL
jgi:hypothetical protein